MDTQHPLIAWMQAVNDTLVDHLDRGDRRLVELGQQLTAFAATQARAVTPDRCPTCGSDKSCTHVIRMAQESDPCPDTWHASAAATPAPEPWRPKYHAGQKVRIKGNPKLELILVPFENTQNYKLQGRNEFFNEDELEPYVWTMPTPPAGHLWYRNDFTADMLPPGTRPLCKGELIVGGPGGDELLLQYAGWRTGEWHWQAMDNTHPPRPDQYWRTKRPPPAPSPAQAEPETVMLAVGDRVTYKDQIGTIVAEPVGDRILVRYDGYEHDVSERLRDLKPVSKPEPTAQTAGEAGYLAMAKVYGSSRWTWRKAEPICRTAHEAAAQAAIAFAQSEETQAHKLLDETARLLASQAKEWEDKAKRATDSALRWEERYNQLAQSSRMEQAQIRAAMRKENNPTEE